jgi:uncharacterized SAM-dependent methyltransferase
LPRSPNCPSTTRRAPKARSSPNTRTAWRRHSARWRTLVDLGAGNCEKAARLFAALRVERYVAVDISVDYLRESLQNLQQQFRRSRCWASVSISRVAAPAGR